jgi:hypothetical protein
MSVPGSVVADRLPMIERDYAAVVENFKYIVDHFHDALESQQRLLAKKIDNFWLSFQSLHFQAALIQFEKAKLDSLLSVSPYDVGTELLLAEVQRYAQQIQPYCQQANERAKALQELLQ